MLSYPYFANENTEAPRGEVVCPGPCVPSGTKFTLSLRLFLLLHTEIPGEGEGRGHRKWGGDVIPVFFRVDEYLLSSRRKLGKRLERR